MRAMRVHYVRALEKVKTLRKHGMLVKELAEQAKMDAKHSNKLRKKPACRVVPENATAEVQVAEGTVKLVIMNLMHALVVRKVKN